MTTPAQEAGWKEGDRGRVVLPGMFHEGDTVTLIADDGTDCPEWERESDGKLSFEYLNSIKRIGPLGHPHATQMASYAQDASETDRPWERWEFRQENEWHRCQSHPIWCANTEYRRRRRKVWAEGYVEASALDTARAMFDNTSNVFMPESVAVARALLSLVGESDGDS